MLEAAAAAVVAVEGCVCFHVCVLWVERSQCLSSLQPRHPVVVLLSFECCAIICGISVSGCDRELEADTK